MARAWERALGAAAPTVTPALVLNADDPAVAHLGRDVGARGCCTTASRMRARAAMRRSTRRTSGRAWTAAPSWRTRSRTTGTSVTGGAQACDNARPKPDIAVTSVMLGDDATAHEIRLPTAIGEGRAAARGAVQRVQRARCRRRARSRSVCRATRSSRRSRLLRGVRAAGALRGRRPRRAGAAGQEPDGPEPGAARDRRACAGEKRALLFFLNDGIADGRDISWIWDADYERVQPQAAWVLASGTRAEDLALRLKYAGFGDDVPVEHDTAAALRRAIEATPAGATLYVVPTYTAMLEVRELLAKQSGARPVLGGRMSALTLRVAHLYPRLMNIYGDRGNIMCLRHRCEARGIGFELTELGLGDRFDALGVRPDLRRRRAGPRAARRRRRSAGDEGRRGARAVERDVAAAGGVRGVPALRPLLPRRDGRGAAGCGDLRPVHGASRARARGAASGTSWRSGMPDADAHRA